MTPLPRKEFFFVRHAETNRDLNIYTFDPDFDLTPKGTEQAFSIAHIVKKIGFNTVITSPLKRAVQTATILIQDHQCHQVVINDLQECTRQTWLELEKMDQNHLLVESQPEVVAYFTRVYQGLLQALSFPDPVLIVAHGGTHFVISYLLQLDGYDKKIDYCTLMHFSPLEETKWNATKIIDSLIK